MDHRTMIQRFVWCVICLVVHIHLTSAVTHSLQYFYTGVTPGIDFPEFTAVAQVDGEQFGYYDSNISEAIPKKEWTKKLVADDPDHLNTNTQRARFSQETFKVDMDIKMKLFNQTTGIHTMQNMFGCELHDDGTMTGYDQYGFDGEDFLVLDMETETYVAPTPQALITKHQYDSIKKGTRVKIYLENICIDWLKKYMGYGRSTLERKVPPEVYMFQKDSSSPVVCHATGFFPKEVMISWQKNGEDVEEEVELRETLRNQDGSFQMRSILTVSPEELNKDLYTCVVQHEGLEKEMVIKAEERRVLSGDGGMDGVIIVAVVVVLLIATIVGVGVFMWKKKSVSYKKTSSEDTDSENSSKLKT